MHIFTAPYAKQMIGLIDEAKVVTSSGARVIVKDIFAASGTKKNTWDISPIDDPLSIFPNYESFSGDINDVIRQMAKLSLALPFMKAAWHNHYGRVYLDNLTAQYVEDIGWKINVLGQSDDILDTVKDDGVGTVILRMGTLKAKIHIREKDYEEAIATAQDKAKDKQTFDLFAPSPSKDSLTAIYI